MHCGWRKRRSSEPRCNARGTGATAIRSRPTFGSPHIKEGPAHRLAAIIADAAEEAPASSLLSTSENNGLPTLNTRELDVIRLLVQGLANKEIAARMEISESTVKNTLQQLFAKTNVRTRAQLVRVALENYRGEL
jgi:DNA-binding NarL/FixJ family response regulator